MRQSACPDSPTLVMFDSVGEAWDFHRAPGTHGLSGLNRNGPGFRVGVILGEEYLGDFLTSDPTGLVDGVGEFPVGLRLS